jgi:hypothetical protein
MTHRAQRLVPALVSAGLDTSEIARGQGVQTAVYLLERAGANLGYRYGWEMFGPFSDDLASVLDDVNERTVDAYVCEPDGGVVDAAGRLRALRERRPGDLSDGLWFRLLACVDFLENRATISLDNGSRPSYLLTFGDATIAEARVAVADVLGAEVARATS